jgi:hypothetical protein
MCGIGLKCLDQLGKGSSGNMNTVFFASFYKKKQFRTNGTNISNYAI